jgi:biotin transport system substrate-specific component
MTTRDIVLIALFAALTAALGLFPPVYVIAAPVTAQSLGVMLAGSVIGARRGGLSMVLFLVLVAVGAPILAGGRGGFGIFLGPSGGFLLAWPVAAFLIGWLTERQWHHYGYGVAALINLIGGTVVIYLIGIPWLAATTDLTLMRASIATASFLPGDVIKVAIAAFVAVTVKRAYPMIEPARRRP